MAGKSVAIDPGSHTTKVLALKDGKTGLEVTAFAAFPTSEGARGLADTGISTKGAVAGVAGRDMTLRYTQVPPAPDWQLRNLMELEISELSSQSGDALSADYNLLPPPNPEEESDSDTILMALARDEALGRVSSLVSEAGGSVTAHVPNCIAIYNAYLRTFTTDEDQVVCIANIGHETVDIALARGQHLLFARNLSGGGRVLDDAIGSAFNVSARKAEQLKKELLDLDPASRGKFASGQAEKVTMAAGGASSMLVSAIQSSLAFCKTQTKQPDLRLDLVLVCGGSGKLRGLRGLLREALHCPVDIFDPFAGVDTTGLDPAEKEELDQYRSEAVVALGLAATVLDDSLYSLEILPEAVKRRQRFVRRTIYNIAAALVLVVVLVLTAQAGSTAEARLKKDVSRARMKVSRAMRIHQDAEQIVESNKVKQELVDALVERSVPFDGTLRVMRALQEHAADDLWIESVEVAPVKGKVAVGRNRVLGIKVKGHGKEVSGRPIAAVYRDVYEALKQRKDLGTLTQTYDEKNDMIEFTWEFDFLSEQPAAKPEKSEEDK